MKGLAKAGRSPGNVNLVDVPEAHAGPRLVRIRVQAATICGSDVTIQSGLRAVTVPVTLGHEFAGIVNKVGDGVSGIRVGDGVSSETDCFLCDSASSVVLGTSRSADDGRPSVSRTPGGFATLAVVPGRGVHALPARRTSLRKPDRIPCRGRPSGRGVWPSLGRPTWWRWSGRAPSARSRPGGAGFGGHGHRSRAGPSRGTSPDDAGRWLELPRPADLPAEVETLRESTRREGTSGVDVALECGGTRRG